MRLLIPLFAILLTGCGGSGSNDNDSTGANTSESSYGNPPESKLINPQVLSPTNVPAQKNPTSNDGQVMKFGEGTFGYSELG